MPLLVETRRTHERIVRWSENRELALSGHTVAETYSVLTRLPGDLRLEPGDAARLVDGEFAEPLTLSVDALRRLPGTLASLGIAGGAVYDALVALAAVEHGAELVTRDARAKTTYEAVGARVVVAG